MTREEAIEHLENIAIYSIQDGYTDEARKALDMAIKALEQKPYEKFESAKVVSNNKNCVTREDILEKARQCVCGDRDMQYGSPEESFKRIADYWSVYLGNTVSAKDVAIMMILFKVAREENKDKADNWIDIAGYAACGGELNE